jgi:hypothetical protein
MAMLSFGGIDVSKDRLDITVLPDEQGNRRAERSERDHPGEFDWVEKLSVEELQALDWRGRCGRPHLQLRCLSGGNALDVDASLRPP